MKFCTKTLEYLLLQNRPCPQLYWRRSLLIIHYVLLMKVSMRRKRKENLKNFYPNECTSERRHLECFVTSLYLVATQVSYCAKGLMGCFILWQFLILTPINWQVNLVNGLNGILHVKDQWNSSWVSYKNGGFLLGYKQKIWNSSGMKINLYQNLQG